MPETEILDPLDILKIIVESCEVQYINIPRRWRNSMGGTSPPPGHKAEDCLILARQAIAKATP